MGDYNSELARAVFAYAQKYKFSILPVSGKVPIASLVPKGHLNATNNSATIANWWLTNPTAGIGIAVKPSGLCVLDIDPRNGGDDSLRILVKEYGEIRNTPHCLTGGGGHHFYFLSHPEVTKCISGLRPGVDVKADGYVVAPPSIHISGKSYAWSVDDHLEDVPPRQMPDWLVKSCKHYYSKSGKNETWKEKILIGPSQGSRNNSVASLSGHLLGRHVDPHIALELVIGWNSNLPDPLPEAEVIRTVESIAKKEIEKRKGQNYE